MAEEPKCPNCGAEVDIGQKMCAWCGADLPKTPLPSASQSSSSNDPGSSTTSPRTGRPTPPGSVHSAGVTSIEEARKLARSGNLDGALITFEYILSKEPHHQEALFGLGGVHFKKGDKPKAAETWLKLKRINPDYPHIDTWVSQVQEVAAPPQASPPKSTPRPIPPTPPQPAPSTFPSRPTRHLEPETAHVEGTHEGDDDWTKQSIRVDVAQRDTMAEPVIDEPTPHNSEPIPEYRPNRIPIWVTPLSWILVIGYAVLFVGVYFLTE